MFEQILQAIVTFVHEFGYFGLFVMTFLESTFTPIPSEITLIPAGYLIHSGDMHFLPVLLACITGTMAGSFFTYWVAKNFGRRLALKYGKFVLFTEDKLAVVEKYFKSHGQISIFTGRLIPGVRHVISFPAGLAHMDLSKFCYYTYLGSTLWTVILLVTGYLIGYNKDLIHQYIVYIKLGALLAAVVMLAGYVFLKRRKLKKA